MTKGEYIRRRGRLLKRLRECLAERKHQGKCGGIVATLICRDLTNDIRKAQHSLCYIRHQYYAE